MMVEPKGATQLYGGKVETTIEGDAIINPGKLVELYGLVTGDVLVKANSVVRVHGMIQGNLIAEMGSVVEIEGMVQRGVRIKGGKVSVSGLILGLVEKESGDLIKKPGAVIRQQAR